MVSWINNMKCDLCPFTVCRLKGIMGNVGNDRVRARKQHHFLPAAGMWRRVRAANQRPAFTEGRRTGIQGGRSPQVEELLGGQRSHGVHKALPWEHDPQCSGADKETRCATSLTSSSHLSSRCETETSVLLCAYLSICVSMSLYDLCKQTNKQQTLHIKEYLSNVFKI